MNIDELPYALRCDGGPGLEISTGDIAGDFTLEAWVRLDPPERGITVFGQPDFGGPGLVLPPGRYDDVTRRLPVGQITVYAGKNREGEKWVFPAGDVIDLSARGVTSIGSVDVPAWTAADFFSDPGCRGTEHTLTENAGDVSAWGSTVRSLRVRASMSSLLVPEGWLIVLFDGPGCEGLACVLRSNQHALNSLSSDAWAAARTGSMVVMDTRHSRQDLAVVFEGPFLNEPAGVRKGHASCFSLGGHAQLGRTRSILFYPYYPDKYPEAAHYMFYDQPGLKGNSFLWNTQTMGRIVADVDRDIPLSRVASMQPMNQASFAACYAVRGARQETDGAGNNTTFFFGDLPFTPFGVGSVLLPPGLRATFYTGSGFTGKAVRCEGEVPDLSRCVSSDADCRFLSLMISRSPPAEDGTRVGCFTSTTYTNPAPPRPIGAGRDADTMLSLCSFIVPQGLRLTFFEQEDWTGRVLELDGNASQFAVPYGTTWKSVSVSQVCGTRPTAARLAKSGPKSTLLNVWDLPVGRFSGLDAFCQAGAKQTKKPPVDRLDLRPGFGARLFPLPDCQGTPVEHFDGTGISLAGTGSIEIFRHGCIFGGSSPVIRVLGEPPSSDVAPSRPVFSGTKLVRDAWHHLAVTRVGSMWTWFLDGKQVAQTAGSAEPISGPFLLGRHFIGFIGPVVLSLGAKTPKALADGRYRNPLEDHDSSQFLAWIVSSKGDCLIGARGATQPLPAGAVVARARFPRSLHDTSLAKGVAARAEAHGNEKLTGARAAASARKRKAELKALTFLQDAHNAAAARAAAAQLEAVWRIEKGQVADAGISPGKPGRPALPPPDPAREITALAADLAAGTLFSAGRDPAGSRFDICIHGGSKPDSICTAGATVHSLVYEPQRRELWWIEHPGKLRRCAASHGSKPVDVTTVPAGTDDLWSLCIEDLDLPGPPAVTKSRLYWSNGREIWRAELKDGALHSPALHVSHGDSLRPVALTVDDTFDEAADPHRGKLFWADRDLGMVRSIDGSGHIRSLYAAACPREALAMDGMLQRLYWNAEHRPSLETAIIEQPGLFYWFEDRGGKSSRHEHIDVLEDAREYSVGFDSDGTLEAQAQPGWVKMPDDRPRRSLLFTASSKGSSDPALNSWIGIGPLFLDCSHGFTAEAVLRFDKQSGGTRLFDLGNSDRHLRILCGLDPTGKSLIFQVFNNDSIPAGISAPFPADGKWHHLVAGIDANGKGTLTLDGREVASGKMALPLTGTRSSNFIGRGNSADAPYLTGRIAMIRLWNRALDAESVAASWQNPFLGITAPDNPFGVFDQHLVRYSRSLVEHRDGRVWLMSGVPDGSWPAVPLMEMAADSSLIPLSRALADHQALIQAHYDRTQARAKQDADLSAARKAADQTLANAAAAAAATKENAHTVIAASKSDADRKRTDAYNRQKSETAKQQQRIAEQKVASKVSRENAAADAAVTEKQARDQKAARVNDANRRLSDARTERTRH